MNHTTQTPNTPSHNDESSQETHPTRLVPVKNDLSKTLAMLSLGLNALQSILALALGDSHKAILAAIVMTVWILGLWHTLRSSSRSPELSLTSSTPKTVVFCVILFWIVLSLSVLFPFIEKSLALGFALDGVKDPTTVKVFAAAGTVAAFALSALQWKVCQVLSRVGNPTV